jgi:hypothetical protein
MTPLSNVFTLAGSVVCIVAVIVAAFVIPQLAPLVFFIACCVLLALAIWLHAAEFGRDEYRTNTLQYSLKSSSSFIVFMLIVLGAIGFYYFHRYNQGSVVYLSEPTPMPPVSAPTMIGGGFQSVAKQAVSRIQQFARGL